MNEIQEIWENLIVIDTAESGSSEMDDSLSRVAKKRGESNFWVKRELADLEIWRMREFCCYCWGEERDSLFQIAN